MEKETVQWPRVLLLAPAYGRRYSGVETATADWNAGKDFQIWNGERAGPYCSNRDLSRIREAGYDQILVTTGPPQFLYQVIAVRG